MTLNPLKPDQDWINCINQKLNEDMSMIVYCKCKQLNNQFFSQDRLFFVLYFFAERFIDLSVKQ